VTGKGERHAQALARHVKAALLHLRQAEGIAKLAGIDIYGGNEVARLIRAAGEATEDLDLWAINNARGHGADPKETYRQTERWCHAPGGELPGNDLAHGMLAPDAVATYAVMLETTDPDPARRAGLRRELAQLTAERCYLVGLECISAHRYHLRLAARSVQRDLPAGRSRTATPCLRISSRSQIGAPARAAARETHAQPGARRSSPQEHLRGRTSLSVVRSFWLSAGRPDGEASVISLSVSGSRLFSKNVHQNDGLGTLTWCQTILC